MTKYVKSREPELIIADLKALIRGRIDYLESKIDEKNTANYFIEQNGCLTSNKKKDIDQRVEYRMNEYFIEKAYAKIEAYESIYNLIINSGYQFKLLFEEIETEVEE